MGEGAPASFDLEAVADRLRSWQLGMMEGRPCFVAAWALRLDGAVADAAIFNVAADRDPAGLGLDRRLLGARKRTGAEEADCQCRCNDEM
jgi:hypothetical protein